MIAAQDWRESALCKGRPARFWFPVVPDGLRVNAGDPYAYGRSICAGCPSKDACLAYALEAGEKTGLWGGLDPAERKALGRGKPKRSRKDPAHGTPAGYRQHRRRGEDACDECSAAHARGQARWKADRRGVAS